MMMLTFSSGDPDSDGVMVGTAAFNAKNDSAGRGKGIDDLSRWYPVALSPELRASGKAYAVTCETELAFYHSGWNPKVNSMEIEMRAEVMNLSRNVKITGDKNGHAGNIVVASYTSAYTANGDPIVSEGTAFLRDVLIDNCG